MKEKRETALVICANDSIEAVVLNDHQRALDKLHELADKHYANVKFGYTSRHNYNQQIYWHTHEVNII